ncbi:MAG: HD domain-containing protein [Oscillospiraceae bacterium]|nr:HD domain-containing protein [Oscillospiraceae bacterium]
MNRFSRCAAVFLAAALIMCLTALTVSAAVDNVPYVVTVYNETNGLPTGEANAVLQTSDGYIWIGSYGGLIRYDGTDFREYSMGQGNTAAVRALMEDSSGRLWIGTNDAGVFVMENDIITHITSPSDGSFLCIRDLTESSDGRIYAASNSGICEIEEGRIIPCTADGISGNTCYSAAADAYGRLWVSMNGGMCAVIKDGELLRTYSSDRFFDDSEIYSTSARNGEILLGSSGNEIAVLSFTSEELDGFEVRYINTGSIRTHNRIDVSDDGQILVCGLQGFAFVDADGSVREFGERHKAMSLNDAACDYEGNIWLASSSNGIIKYTEGCFDAVGTDADMDDVTVNTVAVLPNGVCYAGTDTGLIAFRLGGGRIENKLTELMEAARIRHIITDSSGNVWVASYSENSVVCYEPNSEEITVYSPGNGLIGDRVRVLRELSDGRIAVGTQTGVSIIKDGRIVRSYDEKDGMANASILCFEEGENGVIFAGTDGGGIYELSGDSVICHGSDEGLSDGVVLRMLKNSDGDGYFVSAGSSLYYRENGTFRKLTNYVGAAGSVFDIYDRDGILWVMQNNGIFAVSKSGLLSGSQLGEKEYGFSHGLTGSLNANTWSFLTDEGKLYIPTRNGISLFSFSGTETGLPKVIINTVSVDETVYEHPKEITLGSDVQRITVDFAALSFTDTSKLQITYSLNGFDDRTYQLEDGKSGSVSYTNLPGGTYDFELSICNADDPSSVRTVTMKLVKEKKLSEYFLFRMTVTILLIAVFSAAVFVIQKIRLERVRRRQKEYKQILEQSLLCFAKAIDAKDRYTNGHSARVAYYSVELARRMGLDEQSSERIYYIALLHDIGKIGIPDSILNKPEKLTPEEEEIMKKHPLIGGEILKDFTALADISDGAMYHHERLDGKGYCRGLSAEDIPPVARIISVADTFDAMASDRCYRKALPTEVIKEELKKYSGTQLDPQVVPHMLAMIEEGIAPVDIKGITFADSESNNGYISKEGEPT